MVAMFGLFGKKKDNNAQPPAPQQAPLQRAHGVRGRNQQQANAVLNAPDPDKDTPEDLQAFFQTKKQAVIEEAVTTASGRMKEALGAKMTKIIEGQKKQILAHAQAQVKASIDANPNPKAKDLDPKTLVGESAAWGEAIKVAAEEAATKVDGKKPLLASAGDDAFEYEPDGDLKKSQRDKHLQKLIAIVTKAVDAEAKRIEKELETAADAAPAKQSLVTTATGKADDSAKSDVAGELTAREDNNADLETAVKPAVKLVGDEIREKELNYLKSGLGANGTGWFRSARFKSFHTRMKAAAREKAHESTQAAIDEKRGAGVPAGQKAQFEHQSVQAQIQTHDAAKMELRTIMSDLAKDILGTADGEIKIDEILTGLGNAAGWGALRNNPGTKDGKDAAKKAALAAVKTGKEAADKKLHDKAKELKDEYVKAGDGVDSADQVEAEKDVIDNKITPALGKDTAKGQAFGKKMLTQAIEAPTASKGLQLVAKAIDAAAPQPGDETELQVELKIPATHGAFAYINVTGNAARNKHMEVGIDLGFGAGWETWGLSARGGFNVYLKAGAMDTVTAMQMIHYGAYRNLAQVSDNAASFWAGTVDPGKTASKQKEEVGKTEQAELWAAMMEEKAFGKDKDAFVEVGGGMSAGLKLKAGIDAEVTGKGTTALRWDKDVMDKVKATQGNFGDAGKFGDRSGDRDQRKALAQGKRTAVNQAAKRVNRLKFTTQVEAEANGQKFSIGLEAERMSKEVGADWTIQLAGGIPYDAANASSSTMMSKIASSYVPAALGGVKKLYDLYKSNSAKAPGETEGEGDGAAQITGGVADAGQDLLVGLDAGGMTNNLLQSLSEANPQGLAAPQAEGVNDTARLFMGKDMGMSGGMGDKGDMSKLVSDAPKASPFGMTSQLQIQAVIEIPEGGKPKVTFKVMRQKELKLGGELGGGVGLTGKLTRKQELAGFSVGGDGGPSAWMGGRNQS